MRDLHPLRNDRGAAVILLAAAFAVLLGFAALAVDFGMLLVTRTQLQNAADSAALAAASTMASSGGDQSAARASAILFASQNKAYRTSVDKKSNLLAAVDVIASDVTFPQTGRVTVSAKRTSARGNALQTIFLRAIDPSATETDVAASATASYQDVCGVSCAKPWAPPDRWNDADNSGTYNPGTTNKSEYYDPLTTGFNAPNDIGRQIVLKARQASQSLVKEWYYAVDYPPVNKGNPVPGASQYRAWIDGCPDKTFTVGPGDVLRIEPGNMVGPTNQGVAALIALDPGARWDTATKRVVNSAHARSPRIVAACFIDPSIGVKTVSGKKQVTVVKVFSFFIESTNSSGYVTGRLMRASAPGSVTPCASQSGQALAFKTRLAG
jgi:Flp pilus assembly protein TadG